jgi:hypothetical protein
MALTSSGSNIIVAALAMAALRDTMGESSSRMLDTT